MSPEQIRLQTDRLSLRPLDAEDADVVADYQQRNRDRFGLWDPERPHAFFTSEFWRDQLREDERAIADDRRYRLFVFERSDETRVMGHAHFANVVRGAFQACHLGFGIDHASEGRGLMSEALLAAIAWMFETRGLHRIEANHRPENTRSSAILRRLGFAPQGYARDYLLIDGVWRDHVLTALTNERWSAR